MHCRLHFSHIWIFYFYFKFYLIDVLKGKEKVPQDIIFASLKKVTELADKDGDIGDLVGILTGDQRDRWAKTRSKMLSGKYIISYYSSNKIQYYYVGYKKTKSFQSSYQQLLEPVKCWIRYKVEVQSIVKLKTVFFALALASQWQCRCSIAKYMNN